MNNESPIQYFDRMMRNSRIAMCEYGLDDKASYFVLESIAHSLAVIAEKLSEADHDNS